MPYKNGYRCDRCGEVFDELNEVRFQEKIGYFYEQKTEYLCRYCESVLPIRRYPYIEVISSRRMPKAGSMYVKP